MELKMAIKRIMGTEQEYGIVGQPSEVLDNYKGKRKGHENRSETNESAVEGMIDRGHIGGDYAGQDIDFEVAGKLGFSPAPRRASPAVMSHISKYLPGPAQDGYAGYGFQGFSGYFGRDDMLGNGARFYIDMGHPEYSTPECSNPLSAVIADKAGERVLEQASEKGKVARIFKNNVDSEFNSYGSHENYLMDRKKVKNFNRLADFIRPFLVSRIAFTGSGKVGFRNREKSLEVRKTIKDILDKYYSLKPSAGVKALYDSVKTGLDQVMGELNENELVYQISQRADFFEKPIGLETTFNRPIVNTRDESLSDKSKYMRLHVISGDANLSEIADYLKLGTMDLILDLYEDGKLETFDLEDSVRAMHAISKDPSFKTRVGVEKLGEMTAVEIQKMYQEAAESAYRGRDAMTDDILNRWKFVLDGLESQDPEKSVVLNRWLDWRIKKNLIDSYMNKSGKKLGDTAVRNIDLMYHEINRDKGLFYMLQNNGLVDRLLTDEQIDHAVDNAPEDTRAWTRGELIKKYDISAADWDEVSIRGGQGDIVLKDPFRATKSEMSEIFEQSKKPKQLMQALKEKGYVKKSFIYIPKIPKRFSGRNNYSLPVITPAIDADNTRTKFIGGKTDGSDIQSETEPGTSTKYPGTEPIKGLSDEE